MLIESKRMEFHTAQLLAGIRNMNLDEYEVLDQGTIIPIQTEFISGFDEDVHFGIPMSPDDSTVFEEEIETGFAAQPDDDSTVFEEEIETGFAAQPFNPEVEEVPKSLLDLVDQDKFDQIKTSVKVDYKKFRKARERLRNPGRVYYIQNTDLLLDAGIDPKPLRNFRKKPQFQEIAMAHYLNQENPEEREQILRILNN